VHSVEIIELQSGGVYYIIECWCRIHKVKQHADPFAAIAGVNLMSLSYLFLFSQKCASQANTNAAMTPPTPPQSLTRGDISVILLGRSMPNEYHWAICLAYDTTKAYKLHAKQVSSHWFFEDPPVFEDLLKSDIIAADVKVGT
jgi:hypothetical protein